MQVVEDFFLEIDRQWPREPATKIRLSVIGCGALLLQADYERGTKDSDVFDTACRATRSAGSRRWRRWTVMGSRVPRVDRSG